MSYSDVNEQIDKYKRMKFVGGGLALIALSNYVSFITKMFTDPQIMESVFAYNITFAITLFLAIHLMNKADKKKKRLLSERKRLKSNKNNILQ